MNVEFDADNMQGQFRSRTVLGQPEVPGMANWLVKKGVIKQESKAGGILIGIVIFNIIAIAVILYVFVF